ncbi:uncharacterized protein LOC127286756 [Leptopilina boulardi]|uniref:uncharacterized protein LOC127286756 n=1 Tax=Leptopilina boulardi TaxID=63433 RepID=UPI0021F65DF0|nr:uncharacterized protein LOC127286756 [Leptopilina boulardi]
MKFIINILIATFCGLGYIYGKTFITRYDWCDYLVTILKQDTKIDQLLLLYEADFNNSGIYQIAKNVSRIKPTQIADFRNITNFNNQRMLIFPLLQTTLILIVSSRNSNQNLSNIYNVMRSIVELSTPHPRPKVLIITKVKKRATYQNFFHQLWSKQFLDLSILEVKEIFPGNSNREIAKLHHYNPFTGISVIKKFSKKSILFPNKLRDLNGYQIKAGIFHYPPYVYVKRNSTGHVLNVEGPDINWMVVMSKYLNFTLEIVISNTSNWDIINCNKVKNVGIMNKTIHNEIQFIAIQSAFYDTCLNNFVAISKGTRLFRFVAPAPILPSDVAIFTNELQLFNLSIILSLFLIPVLIARYFNFDRQNWTMMYTIQMVLGSSIPKMPEKIMERIIFSSLLFFYFLQSTFIFSSLSEMQLKKKTFRTMDTFQDLVDAHLTLILNQNLTEDGIFDEKDPFQKLTMNAIVSKDPLDKWLEYLIVNRNITYSCREHLALLYFRTRRNTNGEQKVKIIKEVSGLWPSGIYLEDGSPYRNRFDRIMSVFMESGISIKWDNKYIPKLINQENHVDLFKQELSVTSKVSKLLIILLLFGYSCSVLIFGVEIVIDKYFKS